MTTTTAPPQAPAPARPSNPLAAVLANKRLRLWLLVALGLVVVSSVRVATDARDLTASGTFRAALQLGVPIMLAGLGGLYAERVGVVNIGLEGMMVLGTFGAGYFGYQFGPWAGVLFAALLGAMGGLLHALATVTFGVDQIISGVAINLIAPGVVRFLAATFFEGLSGGSISQGPTLSGDTGRFTLPLVSGGDLFGWKSPDPLVWIERKQWFLVSDLAGILHGVTSDIAWYTVLALVIVPATAYLLWRTSFGLRLRSIGEKPEAADSLGVPVYRIKYMGLAISGAMAGLGGGFLVIESGASRYNEGQTANRGFIGLAALIFGNWRPSGVLTGASVFGFAESLRLRSSDAVLATILLAGIVLAVVCVWSASRRQWIGAAIAAVVSAGAFTYWGVTSKVPTEFQAMLPYLTTLVVLVFASRRLRPPAAAGKAWRKGQTT